jgi:hypothetical protein
VLQVSLCILPPHCFHSFYGRKSILIPRKKYYEE